MTITTTTLALVAVAALAGGEPSREGTGLFGRTPPGPNAVMVRGTFPIPDYGLAVGYDRALARRFSLGGEFEYTLPSPGYGHLAGFAETVDGRIWIGRPLHGVFAEASLTAAHQVLVEAPTLSRTTVAPGTALGFRYTLPKGLSVGASIGLRWGLLATPEPVICTHNEYCGATRTGPIGRLTLDLGWVF